MSNEGIHGGERELSDSGIEVSFAHCEMCR